MIKSFITSHQSVNLINNGAFEFVGSRLHFWKVTGSDTLRGNSYSIGADQSKRFMTVELSSDLPLTLYQSVGSADRPTLDFVAGDLRPTIPQGHLTEELKTLPHGIAYTLAFSIKVRSGSVSVAPHITDLNSETGPNLQNITYVEGSGPMELSRTTDWRRHTFKFSSSHALYEIGLQFARANADDKALFDVTDISLIVGYFDNAPYTGDALIRTVPKDMITMVLGTACPEGFEEVGEDGKFVRSGENRGSSTHSVTTEVGVFRNGTLDFEGYQSKSFVTTFKNSANYPLYDPNNTNDPVDVPDEKGVANHKHTIGDGDSVPVGVLLRMCQRV